MEEAHQLNRSSLPQRLDLSISPVSKNDGSIRYWRSRLYNLGKGAQTMDEVVKASLCPDDSAPYIKRQRPILDLVAKKYLTYEVCQAATSRNGFNLPYVPERYLDADICLAAVNSDGLALEYVPAEILSGPRAMEICAAAVQSDGAALKYVPAELLVGNKGYEVCLIAVSNDASGCALSSVPHKYLHFKRGKTLCENAVKANGQALRYVPKKYVTKRLVYTAIDMTTKVGISPYLEYLWKPALAYVPKRYMSEEIVLRSALRFPESLEYAPANYVTPSLCQKLLEEDPANIRFVAPFADNLVNSALEEKPRNIFLLPESQLTIERCINALEADSSISIDDFPDSIRSLIGDSYKPLQYKPAQLDVPSHKDANGLSPLATTTPRSLDLTTTDSLASEFFYITDIHLEHQLVSGDELISQLSLSDIVHRIDAKIDELLPPEQDTSGTLLIGGDVADSLRLESIFYERLLSTNRWRGRVIATLGNHELWDCGQANPHANRPLDEVISDYRKIMPRRTTLLENELLIRYKGLYDKVLNEQTIIDSSIEELSEVCSNSTLLILGGIGFSGLNPIYNAAAGLYRSMVSPEEDLRRSERFRAIYEKVLACAGNLRVIVLTHMQLENWYSDGYHPGWIYVSGHTHQNKILLEPNGTALLANNQIGYHPKRWQLNSFRLNVCKYDPLANLEDGIHYITREKYLEFNRCQGIQMQGMRYPGKIYAIKNNGIYMFVLKSTSSLCLLEGGRRHKLAYGIDYYMHNLPEYIRRVRKEFTPYHEAISIVSDEVKAMGGQGDIHGCIVDIDFLNHIYLNPFDGTITPYFALDTTYKEVFKSVGALLRQSPIPPRLPNGESMLKQYATLMQTSKVPIISRKNNSGWKLATVSQTVLDKRMYKPSFIMRSIQYVFDNNVLRIWNDEVLTNEKQSEKSLPD